jgi:hypothetical protein
MPLGLVVGRAAWQLVADGLGVAPAIENPVIALLVVVPLALLLVNLVALIPARAASRTQPAVALREG